MRDGGGKKIIWRQEESSVLYINLHNHNREAYILYLSGKASDRRNLDRKRKMK